MRNLFDVTVFLTAVFAVVSVSISEAHATGEAGEYATAKPPKVDWASQLQVSPQTAQQVSSILHAARASGTPNREAVRAQLTQVLTPEQMDRFRAVMRSRHAARAAAVQGSVAPRGVK